MSVGRSGGRSMSMGEEGRWECVSVGGGVEVGVCECGGRSGGGSV